MRSLLAAIVNLVLPTGQTTGQRIVLDGINGVIKIYNSTNQLVAQIDSTGQFEVFDPAGSGALTRMFSDTSSNGILFRLLNNLPHSSDVGSIIAVVGAGGLQAPPELHIQSPGWDATPRAAIHLVGTDLTANPPFIDLVAETGNVDARVNGVSLGRGVVAYQRLTASDVARAANVNTDMALVFTADATRLYRVHCKGQMAIGTAAVIYAVDISEGGTVGANNGTVIERLARFNVNLTAGAVDQFLLGSVLYTPTAGAKTLRVRNAASGGTIAILGSAGNEREFWIEDIGAR